MCGSAHKAAVSATTSPSLDRPGPERAFMRHAGRDSRRTQVVPGEGPSLQRRPGSRQAPRVRRALRLLGRGELPHALALAVANFAATCQRTRPLGTLSRPLNARPRPLARWPVGSAIPSFYVNQEEAALSSVHRGGNDGPGRFIRRCESAPPQVALESHPGSPPHARRETQTRGARRGAPTAR